MQMDCEIVRDIYPLYEENELSPNVKRAVEEHLATCEDCRAVYEQEAGFHDALQQKWEQPKPSKQLDDRIRLRFKLRRMTVIAYFLLTIIVVYFIKSYMAERDQIASTFNNVYGTTEALQDSLRLIKSRGKENLDATYDMLYYDQQQQNKLPERLNWFEKRELHKSHYGLFLQNTAYFRMLKTMETRYDQGNWSNEDEKAYNQLNQRVTDFQNLVKQQYQKLNDGYSSYFQVVDVKKLTQFYTDINDLSLYYNRYHKLPNEVLEISEQKLSEHIKQALDLPSDAKVTIKKAAIMNEGIGTYYFEVKGSGCSLSGKIDAVTNTIVEINNSGKSKLEGELMGKQEAKARAIKILHNLYGEKSTFKLTDEGINYNFSSNVDIKLYSFSFVPTVGPYRLEQSFDGKNIIHINARSGDLYSVYFLRGTVFNNDFNKTEVKIKVSNQEGLKKVEELAKKMNAQNDQEIPSYHFERTGIIYSTLSGSYVPVHVYKTDQGNQKQFVNTITGQVDIPYFYNN